MWELGRSRVLQAYIGVVIMSHCGFTFHVSNMKAVTYSHKHEFQVWVFWIEDLYMSLCAHHPKSDRLPSPRIWIWFP